MNEIEEMAKLTCGVFDSNGACDGCPLRFCLPCAPKARASVLYNAGYRKQEWIPVSEQTPDPNEYDWVLVAHTFNEDGTYGVPTVAELRKDGKWWDLGSEFSLEEQFCTVTHWMPLPGLPKGGGEE